MKVKLNIMMISNAVTLSLLWHVVIMYDSNRS